MNPRIRNILAVIAGLLAGSILNGAIVSLNGKLIALPEGADITTMEGLARSLPLFRPVHFLLPFLGHALGTLGGAWLAAKLAASGKMGRALIVGVFFLCGGIYMIVEMPGAPLWFSLCDIILAYLPMAWAGGRLGSR